MPVRYLPDFSAVAQQVAAAAGPGDVIVTMGAGDVTLLGPEIVTALRVRANRTAPGQPGGVAMSEPKDAPPTDLVADSDDSGDAGDVGDAGDYRCSPRQRNRRTAGSARRPNAGG